MGRCNDRVVVMTGGGSGVAKAAADLFLCEGTQVLMPFKIWAN